MGPQRRRGPEHAAWPGGPRAPRQLQHQHQLQLHQQQHQLQLQQHHQQHQQLQHQQQQLQQQHQLQLQHQHRQQSHSRHRLPAPRSNSSWNRDEVSQYAPRIPPWQRSIAPSNVSPNYRPNISTQYHTFRSRLNWNPSHQQQRKPTPSPWNYQARPLLPQPHYPPSGMVQSSQQGFENKYIDDKPFDKKICDTIDKVKQKLRERKLSETRREKDSVLEESPVTKFTEKKRIEHVKLSPKSPVIKKGDKKDEKVKTSSSSNTSKADQQKRSQILRRKILKQLFKLNNNNLRQFLSNPESSVKYNFALSSLIKDTRNSLSNELRNVAEKSLKFHNIPANTEQGEKIVQDAFLGHLGTMLDTSASIELFNMEPQVINELSKVLQEDLMGSMNEEVSVKNLADVMHESILDEPTDEGFNFDSASSNVDKPFDFLYPVKMEKFDSEYNDYYDDQGYNYSETCTQSDNNEDFNCDLEARLKSIKYENGNNMTESSKSDWPTTNSCSTPHEKSSDSSREQILRNFDMATNRYETTTNSTSEKSKSRRRSKSVSIENIKTEPMSFVEPAINNYNNDVNSNQLDDIDSEAKHLNNSRNSVASDRFNISPDSIRTSCIESASNSFGNSNQNTSCISSTIPALQHDDAVNCYSSSSDKRIGSNVNQILSDNNKNKNEIEKTTDHYGAINRKKSKQTVSSACNNNNYKNITDNKKHSHSHSQKNVSKSKKSKNDTTKSSNSSGKSHNRENHAHSESLSSSSQQTVQNASSTTSQYNKNEPTVKIEKETVESTKPIVIENNKHTKQILADNPQSFNVNKCDVKSVEDVSNRKSVKSTKCQGTQYYDFGKTNASSQVYASLIFSKSKGVQTSKINSRDTYCQTSMYFDQHNSNLVKEFKDIIDKDCQTDELTDNDKKSTCTVMVNKEVQVSIAAKTDSPAVGSSQVKRQSDILSRMKQIDSDIQSLIQEKFKLYKLLEAGSFINDDSENRKFKLKSGFISNVSACKPQPKIQQKRTNSKLKHPNNVEKNVTDDPVNSEQQTTNTARLKLRKDIYKTCNKKRNESTTENKNAPSKLKRSHCSNVSAPSSKTRKRSKASESQCTSKPNLRKTTSDDATNNTNLELDDFNFSSETNQEINAEFACDKIANVGESFDYLDFPQKQNSLFCNVSDEVVIDNDQTDSCVGLQSDVNVSSNTLQNKIVCKRKTRSKPPSSAVSKMDAKKKTPLSTMISLLSDTSDDDDYAEGRVKNDDVGHTMENRHFTTDFQTSNNNVVLKPTQISNLNKKYNLRNCVVKLEQVEVNSSVSNDTDNPDVRATNCDKEKISQGFTDSDLSLSLDEINSVEFENLTDPDIPSMLENIRGSETMTLMDNWDSKLFDSVNLSDSVEGFDNSLSHDDKAPLDLDGSILNVMSLDNNDTCNVNCDELKNVGDFNNTISLMGHSDSIIAIECVGDKFLAASLDGNVYYYCINQGTLIHKLECSNLAITSLWVKDNTVYTGSLDSNLKCFNFDTGEQLRPSVNVGSPIQSICSAWDFIYVGTRTGFVVQYNIKTSSLVPDGAIKFSDQAILAINAIKEGPRKVLLIASRSQDVVVKDANTGLLLRTFHGPNTTVYSLLFHGGNVFCGTSGYHIQVFDFVTGDLIGLHSGGNGAVCLKLYKGLLFAGCYDGLIYVFKPGTERPIASIPGPGKMLLAMAIVNDKIIGGCKDKSLSIWNIPAVVINEMSHCT